MTYKMSEFKSIEPAQIEKLRAAGIESTDDMMRIWADQPKRAALIQSSGITLEEFTSLASMSRLARVKNVGPNFVAVLLAAGIDGPKSLFEHTPDALVKRLGEVAAEKKLTSPVPTLEQITSWFNEPKPGVAVPKPEVVAAK